MIERVVARAKRTALADVARRARDRLRPAGPLVSVVVPFYDARDSLEECVTSLLAQTHRNLEVVLVDDGSVDGSLEVARALAHAHRKVVLVEQQHGGVGAARNAGARRARGEFLAFCDADDRVLEQGYERMVRTLVHSGADMCIGSLTLQRQGRHQRPPWAWRSNASRALAVTLDDWPQVMANLVPGTRLFRRSFWQEHALAFPEGRDYADVVPMVRALLACRTFDIVPSVVYQWRWRPDNRSLLQRALVDQRRAAELASALVEAGRLLVPGASEQVRTAYFAEVLHTTVPDLVRAAVTRDDGYWETLGRQLATLVEGIPEDTWLQVPVEDRLTAWLCAQDRRQAEEQFLEYAFDNQTGMPFETVAGRPHVRLPFIEELADLPQRMTAVADSELRFRTRMTALRWLDDHRLEISGGAFTEYVDTSQHAPVTTLVLRDAATGEEWRLPTEPAPELAVNQWAQRAHEDHDPGGFRCVVDCSVLPGPAEGRRELDVDVETVVAGQTRRGPFASRLSVGSAGLLERRVVGALAVVPVWRSFVGLKLRLRAATPVDAAAPAPEHPGRLQVAALSSTDGRLRLSGVGGPEGVDVRVALVGPRAGTDWVPVAAAGPGFTVVLDTTVDEWGAGPATLPADRYRVVARTASGVEEPVMATADLWRQLPSPVADGSLLLEPQVEHDGSLHVRVVPAEWPSSRPPYLRRRLRDQVYPAAREKPLLDTVLFETFAGKAGGDNPGALCRELAQRDERLELVFSVIDRSVQVPAGARAVIRFSEEYFELLGRARYLLVNASLPYFFRKREGQLYFQTWHGTPLKRIAHDRPHLDFFNWHHRRQLLIARDGWDYLLSQSEFCSRSLSSAFRYSGPVMEAGYPRNDVLSSADAEKERLATRRRLAIPDSAFVVLYAPTWRDNLRVGRVFEKVLYLDPHRLVDELGDAVVLVRGHYNSVQAAEESDPDQRVRDVTRYPDIADLYLASDALVTDYSSVYFDYVITDKPIVFLAPDLVQYRDDNRGFYLDYESTVPGPICLTTDEVAASLQGPDAFAERRRRFRAEFAPHDDGGASARVVDAILATHPYR